MELALRESHLGRFPSSLFNSFAEIVSHRVLVVHPCQGASLERKPAKNILQSEAIGHKQQIVGRSCQSQAVSQSRHHHRLVLSLPLSHSEAVSWPNGLSLLASH